MENSSAFGVSLLVLFTATLLVGPSAANDNHSFHSVHQSLRSLVSEVSISDMMRSYQQQTNTISLDRATLDEPHWLTVSIPVDTDFAGEILINHETRLPLDSRLTRIDLSPYLTETANTVAISGNYAPESTSLAVIFDGPNTLIQQQTGGTGKLNYQLILLVD